MRRFLDRFSDVPDVNFAVLLGDIRPEAHETCAKIGVPCFVFSPSRSSSSSFENTSITQAQQRLRDASMSLCDRYRGPCFHQVALPIYEINRNSRNADYNQPPRFAISEFLKMLEMFDFCFLKVLAN